MQSEGMECERGEETNLRLRGKVREEDDEVEERRSPMGTVAIEEVGDGARCPPIVAKQQLHLFLYGSLAAALVIFHVAGLLTSKDESGGSWHVNSEEAQETAGSRRGSGGWKQNKTWCELSAYHGLFCTPNHYAYHSDGGVLGGREHCRRLKKAGIRTLRLQGDSMIREPPSIHPACHADDSSRRA